MHSKSIETYRKFLLLTIVAVYIVSLCVPGLILTNDTYGPPQVRGITILIYGWMGGGFAWLANPLFFLGLFSSRAKLRLTAASLSILAFFFGFYSFSATKWWWNEGGATTISHLGLGYYIWQTVLLLGVIYCLTGEQTDIKLVRGRKKELLILDYIILFLVICGLLFLP